MIYDTYSVYESVGWFYRLMGCFPFVLNGPPETRGYILNTVAVTFNILFFIIGAKYFYDYLYMVNRRYTIAVYDDSFTIIIVAMRQFFTIICVLDAMILKIIHSKKIISSIKNIATQDDILKSFGYKFKYKLACKLNFAVTGVILLISYSAINLEFLILIKIPLSMALRIFGNMTVVVQFTNITLYCFLLINVGFRFKALNICMNNRNYDDVSMALPNNSTFQFIKTSAKVHADLCKQAKKINNVFTVTVVGSVIKVFFLSSAMTYFIYLGFKFGIKFLGFQYMLVFFGILLTNIWILVMIVLSCNWTSEQAHATIKILHQLALKENCLKNECLNEMVRTFLMQISHHDLKFTAADLFTINSSLLQSFTVVLTTYLVILIEINPEVI